MYKNNLLAVSHQEVINPHPEEAGHCIHIVKCRQAFVSLPFVNRYRFIKTQECLQCLNCDSFLLPYFLDPFACGPQINNWKTCLCHDHTSLFFYYTPGLHLFFYACYAYSRDDILIYNKKCLTTPMCCTARNLYLI